MYERLTINLSGKAKKRKLRGRDYVVAPAAILREGVLNGSAGPIFYPDAENAKSVMGWNSKPIVVYHPVKNDQPISAADPDVIETCNVGMLLNTRHDPKDHRVWTECWFDVEYTNQVDRRILVSLNKEEPIEGSTGLGFDFDKTPGDYGGQRYEGSARNYQPDHFAVLPDQIGAFSVKDGGGVFAMNARLPERTSDAFTRSMEVALGAIGITLADNELSHSDVSRQLMNLLASKHGEPGKYWNGHLCEVCNSHVVFRNGDGGPYMKQGYVVNGGAVSLDGDAEEVTRTVEYVTANGAAFVLNSAGLLVPKGEETTMAFDKTAHITGLIGNGWEEGDRAFLTGLPDAQLQKIKPVVNAAPTPPPTPTPTPNPTPNPAPTPTPTPVPPPPPSHMTTEQYIANAPPGIREVLMDQVQAANAERERLVKDIVAYPQNQFPEDQLKATPIVQLRMLHNMIPQNPGSPDVVNPLFGANAQPLPPNYLGAAGGPPTVNAANALPAEGLATPSYNFKSVFDN